MQGKSHPLMRINPVIVVNTQSRRNELSLSSRNTHEFIHNHRPMCLHIFTNSYSIDLQFFHCTQIVIPRTFSSVFKIVTRLSYLLILP